MGLTDNYSHASIQILMMSKPPIVDQCYAMIIQDESKGKLSGDHYNIGGKLILIPSSLIDLEEIVMKIKTLEVHE